MHDERFLVVAAQSMPRNHPPTGHGPLTVPLCDSTSIYLVTHLILRLLLVLLNVRATTDRVLSTRLGVIKMVAITVVPVNAVRVLVSVPFALQSCALYAAGAETLLHLKLN